MKNYANHMASCLLYWFLFCLALSSASTTAAQREQGYLVGRGTADITGPLVGVQLWGFGRADQLGEGLHIRQRARAFVMAERGNAQQRLVFVSADLGSVDHHVTLEVVERLQKAFPDTYSLDNVIISATHTHAGPGGHWHSRSDTGLDGGLYPEHFEAIAAGITAAIVAAHEDLQPGQILINSGEVANAGANRSVVAYQENPAQERAQYSSNTNKEMVLLKFVDATGEIGMLNWYALHPTAMNFHNRLVSGDHKGYASLSVEREKGATYGSNDEFVAAFAQADPGDVTPNTNLDNTGPGATDVETTQIMGDRQATVAQQLFDSAEEPLQGKIDTRRMYVNLNGYEVDGAYTGAGAQKTCPSAYGYSFAGGSSEDGGAHFLFREGMTDQSMFMDWLIRFVTGAPKWTQAVKDCQAPKPILFETGTGNPPLQSQVRSVTVARIGQLVILALPAEVTTMSGRRLRQSVMNELGDWAEHIVLAGYSNGFAGYVTTPEEYMLQQYEGAHTLHGRWSLPAYQQVASQLAAALGEGASVESVARYDDWRGKSPGEPLPRGEGVQLPADLAIGDVIEQPAQVYSVGSVAEAQFVSTHPNLHFQTGLNFLRVERQVEKEGGKQWQLVADDSDWSTTVRWRDEGNHQAVALKWEIDSTNGAGQYRLVHEGLDLEGRPFLSATKEFEIK
ncbi:MAG: neutral/alkaline non-lysosomal ceramidase N-terminal domain-containing protein [Halioglobus sp.]